MTEADLPATRREVFRDCYREPFSVIFRLGLITLGGFLPCLFVMWLRDAYLSQAAAGGGVIWGGIRDTQQMKAVEGVQVYYRGIDPTPIREFVMKDFNGITRIGKATILPGDIVYGAGGGVLFIPAHLTPDALVLLGDRTSDARPSERHDPRRPTEAFTDFV